MIHFFVLFERETERELNTLLYLLVNARNCILSGTQNLDFSQLSEVLEGKREEERERGRKAVNTISYPCLKKSWKRVRRSR